MRSETKTRAKVISCFNAEEFETRLNEAFDSVGGSLKKILFNMNAEGHCAYILYDYTKKIAESARDKALLDGDAYVCGECPFFVPPTDGRKKKGYCEHMQDWALPRDMACTWLYRQIAKGEIDL